jgi:8-oxo-dGTP pyrophosphatase MutT (NUDIX family)
MDRGLQAREPQRGASGRPPGDSGSRPGAASGRIPTKISVGIILCRRNDATGRPEVLLVHKRYTYAFSEFVHGRYMRGGFRSNPAAMMRAVSSLLGDMTTEELLDVLSLNFEQMWYRIWLTHEKRELYNRKYSKFLSTFLREDGGDSLRRAVLQARGGGSLLWEVPKGRRQSSREADVLCAVRELREEAGVEKSEYRLLAGVRRRINYTSAGTRYICIYYIAIANPRLARASRTPGGFDPGRPALRDLNLMGEVSEVRWHDIEQIRLLERPGTHLESLVAPAFRLFKLYMRGRWASRRPPAVSSGAGIDTGAEREAVSDGGSPLAGSGGWQVARGSRGGRGSPGATAESPRPPRPLRPPLPSGERRPPRRRRGPKSAHQGDPGRGPRGASREGPL